jgi:hypothetical protein
VLHPSQAQVKESSAPERAKDSHGEVEVGTLIPRCTDVTNGPEAGRSSAFANSVLSRIQDADGQECAVCFDLMDLPVLVPNRISRINTFPLHDGRVNSSTATAFFFTPISPSKHENASDRGAAPPRSGPRSW